MASDFLFNQKKKKKKHWKPICIKRNGTPQFPCLSLPLGFKIWDKMGFCPFWAN